MPWRKHALEFAGGIRGKDPGAHARGSSIDHIAARADELFTGYVGQRIRGIFSSRRNLLRRAKRDSLCGTMRRLRQTTSQPAERNFSIAATPSRPLAPVTSVLFGTIFFWAVAFMVIGFPIPRRQPCRAHVQQSLAPMLGDLLSNRGTQQKNQMDASKNWPSYGVSDSIALKESETSRCAASLDFLMLLSV